MDWFASGLPGETAPGGAPRAGDVARRDAPTCGLRERVGDVARRLPPDWDLCVVVNERAVVLGLLDAEILRRETGKAAEDAMRPAPRTWRPHIAVEEIAQALAGAGRDDALITTSDGVLVGVLRSPGASAGQSSRVPAD